MALWAFCSQQLKLSSIHELMPKEVKWSRLEPTNVSPGMRYIKHEGIASAHWDNLEGIWNAKGSYSEPKAIGPGLSLS